MDAAAGGGAPVGGGGPGGAVRAGGAAGPEGGGGNGGPPPGGKRFAHPGGGEESRPPAGRDIGGTLSGMHLGRGAVPVRLSLAHIGQAALLCARTRPKLIGGERAKYTEED